MAYRKFDKPMLIKYFKKMSDDAGADFPLLTEDQICLVSNQADNIEEDNEEYEDRVAEELGKIVKPFVVHRLGCVQQNIKA